MLVQTIKGNLGGFCGACLNNKGKVQAVLVPVQTIKGNLGGFCVVLLERERERAHK